MCGQGRSRLHRSVPFRHSKAPPAPRLPPPCRYVVPREDVDAAWLDADLALHSPLLPLAELEEVMAALGSRLPGQLAEALRGSLADYRAAAHGHVEAVLAAQLAREAASAAAGEEGAAASVAGDAGSLSALETAAALLPPELPAKAVLALLAEHAATLPPRARPAFETLVCPLTDVLARYADAGLAGAKRLLLHSLLSESQQQRQQQQPSCHCPTHPPLHPLYRRLFVCRAALWRRGRPAARGHPRRPARGRRGERRRAGSRLRHDARARAAAGAQRPRACCAAPHRRGRRGRQGRAGGSGYCGSCCRRRGRARCGAGRPQP